jgi:DNA-binding NarL/FixJ family response regulator
MSSTKNKTKQLSFKGKFELLTPGEKRIVSCILNEKSNHAIAIELAIKQNTVSTFRKNIYNKLGVTTSIGLYKLALKEGIVK